MRIDLLSWRAGVIYVVTAVITAERENMNTSIAEETGTDGVAMNSRGLECRLRRLEGGSLRQSSLAALSSGSLPQVAK
jgi:hypothetical protein